MRNIIIAGNWKMNKTFSEAEDFFVELTDFLNEKELDKVEVVVCSPSPYLEMASDFACENQVFIGAQNVNENDLGAYTGEISASMLKSMEIDYCIIGHSERRKFFHETDDLINVKLKKLQESEVVPILCIGETLEEREKGITEQVIISQLTGALKEIKVNGDLVIAYEPVWAIGTGRTATPEQAQEIHSLIRKWISEKFSSEISDSISILYGGSMKPENIRELLHQPDIDGGLIGGASLDIEKFKAMINTAVEL
jgi:triosephosphate isomerase